MSTKNVGITQHLVFLNSYNMPRYSIFACLGEEPHEIKTLCGQDVKEENQKLYVRYEDNKNDKLVFHFHFEDALAELREIARVSSQDSEEEVSCIIFPQSIIYPIHNVILVLFSF